MKFQPRRFVVEVKRGTSRTAFTSPDTLSQKFSSAEELLFGGPKSAAVVSSSVTPKAAKSNGRILESLIEPPPPPDPVEEFVERPRRGRKPGSKNKPKVPPTLATSPAPFAPAGIALPRLIEAIPAELAAFDGDGPAWRDDDDAPRVEAEAPGADRHPAREQAGDRSSETGRDRPRLRERSSIIKRYVLGTEPRPGQPGYLRARRAARAG